MNTAKQTFRDPLLKRVVNKGLRVLRATPPGVALYRFATRSEPQFVCPACGYRGALVTLHAVYGERRHAECPKCGALERHRLLALVLDQVERRYRLADRDILHFAPEPIFRARLEPHARSYRTSDLVMRNVDMRADLVDLPVETGSIDILVASYILQYIADDRRALREIHRVLRPGGFAVLPVTVVSDKTVEYPEPNLAESGGHVRAPGTDYFERFSEVFAKVDIHASQDYPDVHQTYVYEDRTGWPTKEMPLRRAMPGERHPEYIPICWR